MSKLYRSILIFSLLASPALGLYSCSDDNNPNPGGPGEDATIELSETEVNLPYKPTEDGVVVDITMTNASGWNIDRNDIPEWLKLTPKDNSLTVNSLENYSSESRSVTLTVVAIAENSRAENGTEEIIITQSGRLVSKLEIKTTGIGALAGISANGRYLIGNGTFNECYLWDAEENYLTFLGGEDKGEMALAYGVDNDGTVVGGWSYLPAIYKGGSWSGLEIASVYGAGAKSVDCTAWSITPDGKIITGHFWDTKTTEELATLPLIWEDGKVSVLPTTIENPYNYTVQAIVPIQITPDAKFIVARVGINNSAVYLTGYWDESRTFHYIDHDPVKNYNGGFFPIASSISPDGKYLMGEYRWNMTPHPWYYDIQTKEHKIWDNIDGYAFAATPEGDIIIVEDSFKKGHIVMNGSVIEQSEWLMSKYGLELPKDGVITMVSADGKYFGGVIMDEGTVFRVTAGERVLE